MITLGLTGMSGSGKSYIAAIFQKYSVSSVNADAIVHRLYATDNTCTRLLKERFGACVLRADHSVNRKALATIVFSDKEKLALLNQTIHPFVVDEIKKEIQSADQNSAKAVIIDAPQLFEAGLDKDCDYVIAVIADEKSRIRRISARDGISEDAARLRLSHQHSDHFFREKSDFCIQNSDSDDPEGQIRTILKALGFLA